MASKRLFFALWPDDRQRDRLRDVINSVAKTVEGKAVDRRSWHITLAYIGEYPEEQIPDLQARAREIEVKPFTLSFDRLEYWPRPKIACMVGPTVPAELEALVLDLHGLMQDVGLVPEDRTYRPHITVVRNARAFTAERLSQRTATDWSGFELIESVGGPGGASYRPLKQ